MSNIILLKKHPERLITKVRTSIAYNTKSRKYIHFQDCDDIFSFIVWKHENFHPFRYIVNFQKYVLLLIQTHKLINKQGPKYQIVKSPEYNSLGVFSYFKYHLPFEKDHMTWKNHEHLGG